MCGNTGGGHASGCCVVWCVCARTCTCPCGRRCVRALHCIALRCVALDVCLCVCVRWCGLVWVGGWVQDSVCVSGCVCMYVYICVCVCMCVRRHVCLCVSVCVRVFVCDIPQVCECSVALHVTVRDLVLVLCSQFCDSMATAFLPRDVLSRVSLLMFSLSTLTKKRFSLSIALGPTSKTSKASESASLP